MRKTGKQGVVCIYCDNAAMEDTDPPVCSCCADLRKTAKEAEPPTLKQLVTAPANQKRKDD